MKVFLDDLREFYDNSWIRTYTVPETIALLETNEVKYLSLDNDLGEDQIEGYKVVDWLEEKAYTDPTFIVPNVIIHSDNAVRREYMKKVLKRIRSNEH
jgi:hypothetical protein